MTTVRAFNEGEHKTANISPRALQLFKDETSTGEPTRIQRRNGTVHINRASVRLLTYADRQTEVNNRCSKTA